MANIDCNACEELRQTDQMLLIQGFSEANCTSMKNDTGLVSTDDHNDCEDLDNMNDCLIGNMAAEIEAYDVCDWKKFMGKYLPNQWTVTKAIICAICGIWTNIHNIWDEIEKIWEKIAEILEEIRNLWSLANRIDCIVNYMAQGHSFSLGEAYVDTSHSYIVAGKGASFLNVSQSGTSSDISLTYIGGGLGTILGSVKLYTSNFTDGATCYNYDTSGVDPVHTQNRSGNSAWSGTDTKPDNGGSAKGSELIYEIRVNHADYPEIGSFFTGLGHEAENGGFTVNYWVFNGGEYADGQHGSCDTLTGDPNKTGWDRGHLVPAGWTYIQCRLSWIDSMSISASGSQFSPHGFIGMRMNPNAITC